MPSVLLQRHLGSLRPCDALGAQQIDKIKPNEVVRAEIKRVRNPKQHRLYWAAINLCFMHQDRYATAEQLHNAVKVWLGYYEEMVDRTGKRIAIPKSIAFGNMPQDEWEQFFDRFIKLVCEQLIPNVTDEELRAELESMVSGNEAAA